MDFTAIFENWLLGDGSYPALQRGQLVNLAFQLRPTALRRGLPGPDCFGSLGDATCRLYGTVLRVYTAEEPPVAVVEANGFRCYVESPEVRAWDAGERVATEGTIAVDYYVWSEFLADRYADAPGLFHPLRVTHIRRVWIPERFITRTGRSLVAPTSVALQEVAAEDVEEVEAMEPLKGDARDTPAEGAIAVYRPAFFLVDFADDDLPLQEIPRTFR